MLSLQEKRLLYQQVFLKREIRVKKLVLVLATSTLVIVAREKAVKNAEDSKNLEITTEVGKNDKNQRSNLAQVLCIRYPITFKRKSELEFFDQNSEINAIHPTFAKKLGFFIKLTNTKVQKIDDTILDIYKMVVVIFLETKKANQVRFIKETFLVAIYYLEVVFEIFILTLSIADIDF